MKAIKGVFLFCFLGGFVTACFDPPEFSDIPNIQLNKLEFKVTPDISDADSLIIYIDFKDGNGDMGLDDNYLDDPYHERNFYFENTGNNTLTPVGTIIQSVNNPAFPPTIQMIIEPSTGKLATNRTRLKPGFGFLPPFNSADLECLNYTTQYLLIAPPAHNSIDASYSIADTLYDQGNNEYFLLKDTLYFERNLNHYNILVRFYESSGSGFTEFSWEEEFCTTFNGRFPVLSDDDSPLEGTIRYAMTSTGFTPLFSIKTLMLDIIVKDRAFNKDSIRTPEFTLD
ncbi:MAG: hypothetical protein OEU76_08640, partial [Cyclobacteriaceae bacterium]|nr:hypothetical protein [Cyclobacteriaceae bacterium]